MRQLVEHIQKSIYGPAYYQELLQRPFLFSWKYYSALALAIAVFLTIVSSIPLVPLVSKFVHNFPEKFFAYYPDELEVKVEKGVVSSSVTEPYFLPIPQILEGVPVPYGDSGHLVVIDTKTPFSLEQFRAYRTTLWVGSNQLAVDDGNGGIRVAPLDSQASFTVNKNMFRQIEPKLEPFYKFVAPGLVLVILIGLLIGLSVNFVYLLFGAVLILFLGRLLKQRWSYGTSYRIGLHAITLPLLLTTVLSLLSFSPFDVPFLYSAMMLTMVYVNFKGAVSTPAILTQTK